VAERAGRSISTVSAAHYFHAAAERLMQFYLEQTSRINQSGQER